jgi:hypothetical protein
MKERKGKKNGRDGVRSNSKPDTAKPLKKGKKKKKSPVLEQ